MNSVVSQNNNDPEQPNRQSLEIGISNLKIDIYADIIPYLAQDFQGISNTDLNSFLKSSLQNSYQHEVPTKRINSVFGNFGPLDQPILTAELRKLLISFAEIANDFTASEVRQITFGAGSYLKGFLARTEFVFRDHPKRGPILVDLTLFLIVSIIAARQNIASLSTTADAKQTHANFLQLLSGAILGRLEFRRHLLDCDSPKELILRKLYYQAAKHSLLRPGVLMLESEWDSNIRAWNRGFLDAIGINTRLKDPHALIENAMQQFVKQFQAIAGDQKGASQEVKEKIDQLMTALIPLTDAPAWTSPFETLMQEAAPKTTVLLMYSSMSQWCLDSSQMRCSAVQSVGDQLLANFASSGFKNWIWLIDSFILESTLIDLEKLGNALRPIELVKLMNEFLSSSDKGNLGVFVRNYLCIQGTAQKLPLTFLSWLDNLSRLSLQNNCTINIAIWKDQSSPLILQKQPTLIVSWGRALNDIKSELATITQRKVDADFFSIEHLPALPDYDFDDFHPLLATEYLTHVLANRTVWGPLKSVGLNGADLAGALKVVEKLEEPIADFFLFSGEKDDTDGDERKTLAPSPSDFVLTNA